MIPCYSEFRAYALVYIYMYIYIHIYHIYVCMYICLFFFLFGELLSTLSGEKYIIAKECLSANQTQVLAIYIFLY